MPRLTPAESAAAIVRNLDKLPELCAARLMSDGSPIYIKRGHRGYWPATSSVDVDAFNKVLGVTPAQREAMHAGSLFGWHVPGADPDSYDENGVPLAAKHQR